jgi:adenine-specific DNA-methyltransferase
MRLKRTVAQPLLFTNEHSLRPPPSTRYQGSKFKLLDWIWDTIKSLDFYTVLDAFGGTACVSYLLKSHHKKVTYNDYLHFNHLIGTALIENRNVTLSSDEVRQILCRNPNRNYDDLISTIFEDIYFTNEENRWLDIVVQNISTIPDKYKRAIGYYALFQSCTVKRPYNLFHRKNLYMRLADVQRSFGNKSAWDAPFEDHFRTFVTEANTAVFDSGIGCRALCCDVLSVPGSFDLVYLDPPYVNSRGSTVDYRDFYHFLEGLVVYSHWREEIDDSRKHLPLKGARSPWSDPKQVTRVFRECLQRYTDSTIVLSYGNKGIPGAEEIAALLKRHKRHVRVTEQPRYKYVLSTDTETKELLFVAW